MRTRRVDSFTMRLSPGERERLEAVARRAARTKADVLRLLLERAEAEPGAVGRPRPKEVEGNACPTQR